MKMCYINRHNYPKCIKQRTEVTILENSAYILQEQSHPGTNQNER